MPKLRKTVPFATLCVAGAAVCLFLLGPGVVWTWRGATDFMDLYAGAKLSFTHDQYNVARVLATELQYTGYYSPTRLFMRLPVFGLLLWPLARLPYSLAAFVWELLCLGAIAGFAALWPSARNRVILFCCWSLPAWMTLAEGQDTALLLLWIALAVIALRKEQQVLAGLVLSLCAAKFHLFLLLPLWIVGCRLWRVASGLAIGGTLLMAGSFAAGGLDWPWRYGQLLTEPTNNPYAELMPNLHGLFSNSAHAEPLELLGASVIALLCWLAIRKLDAISGLAPVLIGGVLVAPHDYMADCVLLLPALAMLLSRRQSLWITVPCLFLVTPVAYAALTLRHSLVIIAPLVSILFTLAVAGRSEGSTLPLTELCPSVAADSQAQ